MKKSKKNFAKFLGEPFENSLNNVKKLNYSKFSKKKRVILVAIILSIVFILLFLYVGQKYLTGFSILEKIFNPVFLATGRLFITINFFLKIDSPRNITYNYSLSDSYPIDLKVIAERNITSWNYTLIDMKHNVYLYNNVNFTPNITIYAKRWSNKLIVTGKDLASNLKHDTVDFFIYVNNSAPIIQNTSTNVLACEGLYFSYTFNASDIDEDYLSANLNPGYPSNPFFIAYISSYNYTLFKYEVFSGVITKNNFDYINSGSKSFNTTISVSDANYSDRKNLTITLIEINNPPVLEHINNTEINISMKFFYRALVNDIEDGNQNSSNMTFNISFSNLTSFNMSFSNLTLFNISRTGIMNFTPNRSHIGSYNVTVCVTDRAITNPHPNISLCGYGGNITVCTSFVLNITEHVVNDIIDISGGGGGGGGGGGLPKKCIPKWGCSDWRECKPIEKGLELNETTKKLYEEIIYNCTNMGLRINYCGYQFRDCIELNGCNKIKDSKPAGISPCHYTQTPNCTDGIKNCHNGSCEVLIDCGGRCEPCPTCSDNIRNQGEEGIDCGGPCLACFIEVPYKAKQSFLYIFVIIVIILVIAIIVFIIRYISSRRNLEDTYKKSNT